MRQLTITIQTDAVLHQVLSDTFLTGVVDKAADENAVRLAYQEQAGDDETHLSILFSSFVAVAEALVSRLTDYCTLESTAFKKDTSVIVLLVPDRFNPAYNNTLPRLMQKYIQDDMLSQWWSPINPKRSEPYTARLSGDFEDILRCFNRLVPRPPGYPYPTRLTVESDSVSLSLASGAVELKYSVWNAIDDIVSVSSCHRIFTCENANGVVTLMPVNVGNAILTLYSLHDEVKVFKNISVNVTE